MLRERAADVFHTACTHALLAGLGLALSLTPRGGLAAQVVTGAVSDGASGLPVNGAFVVLEDSAGTRADAVLSNSDGAFTLEAPAAGPYRLVVELIGFQTTRTGLFAVPATGAVEQQVRLETRAVDLLGIQVEARPRCGATRLNGEVSLLWEEARKALSLSRWGEGDGALTFEVREHLRVLDASDMTLLEEAGRAFDGAYRESPYRSLDPEALARDGYIQEDRNGELVYYAPDAEVLLSDPFLDTHCFYATESLDDPDLVGLAFRPVPGRELPEVRGVLWLSRATAELQSLDYTYVGTPSPTDWEAVGGQVVFARLGTGVWVVDRWRIRMPRAAQREGGLGGSRPTWRLVELLERGATTTRVRLGSGEVISEATWGSMSGIVRERGGGDPLEGVTVSIPALDRSTRTAASGVYRLADIPPGSYRLQLDHPSLRILGLPPVQGDLEVPEDGSIRGDFDLGLSTGAAREVCGSHGEQGRQGGQREQGGQDQPGESGGTPESSARPVVLFGQVTSEASGVPGTGAVVTLRTGDGERRVLADSLGFFRACAPGGAPIELAATVGGSLAMAFPEADAVEVDASDAGFVRVDLNLSAAVMATSRTTGTRAWENAILGSVRDADGGTPVANVAVRLVAPEGQSFGPYLTDAEGRFRIPHPAAAGEDFTLEAERLGYATLEAPVRFGRGEEVSLEVRMSAEAVALEPLVVTARRRGLLAEAGYYERRERGLGQFIEREEIERRVPTRPTDLFQGMPGVSVINVGPFGRDVRLNIQTTFRDMAEQCQPKLVLDGVVVRQGGAMTQGMRTQGGGVIPAVGSSMDDLVNISNVEAMEVYTRASAIPAEYGGLDTACGVILFWTRRD
jgi:hypothetical protein